MGGTSAGGRAPQGKTQADPSGWGILHPDALIAFRLAWHGISRLDRARYDPPMKEATARIKINKLLENAGWRFFADANGPANIQLEPNVKLG